MEKMGKFKCKVCGSSDLRMFEKCEHEYRVETFGILDNGCIYGEDMELEETHYSYSTDEEFICAGCGLPITAENAGECIV